MHVRLRLKKEPVYYSDYKEKYSNLLLPLWPVSELQTDKTVVKNTYYIPISYNFLFLPSLLSRDVYISKPMDFVFLYLLMEFEDLKLSFHPSVIVSGYL